MTLLDGTWVTEGGLETDLIFNFGVDLPEFAVFPLLDTPEGVAVLIEYYRGIADIAATVGAGLLIETPTWRASADWGLLLGYDAAALDRANRAAVALVRSVTDAAAVPATRVSGCIGPRGDGYIASDIGADGAADYHEPQIRSLASAGADLVHAMTMTSVEESIGVVTAARAVGVPVAISFTVETDGRLPDGSALGDAVAAVDASGPADFYGINCAHPSHVLEAIDGDAWQSRLTIFRPNASTLSHAELDEMEELDAGDLAFLESSTRTLLTHLPEVRVLGGCCGTDRAHVAALAGVART